MADHYGVFPFSFAQKHSEQISRHVAAWLAQRLTMVTLRKLADPDSVRNLIRRGEHVL